MSPDSSLDRSHDRSQNRRISPSQNHGYLYPEGDPQATPQTIQMAQTTIKKKKKVMTLPSFSNHHDILEMSLSRKNKKGNDIKENRYYAVSEKTMHCRKKNILPGDFSTIHIASLG